ncbi:ribonuclease III [Mycoplasma leonicaptivi]|uniref:ribonuclease III n=1 Tax=Mycoplasma leonicaptivi TaxID=36742 RepID=UPI00047F95CC|nr:ribonuclease III [Mycoplasma leonicaptivi]
MTKNHIQNIEEFLNKIALEPKNIYIFQEALTHRSFANTSKKKNFHYDRLEFLGDAILDFIASVYVFKNNSSLNSGELSRLRSSIISTETLMQISDDLGLTDILRTGPGLTSQEVKNSPKVRADIFEAFLGAIFVDQGLSRSIEFVHKYLLNQNSQSRIFDRFSQDKDPKTELQEHFQSISKQNISYEIYEQDINNIKHFTAKAVHDGIIYGIGEGKSKKEAQNNAAKSALEKLNIKEYNEIS